MTSLQEGEGSILAEAFLGCLEENTPREFDASNAHFIPCVLRSIIRHLLCEGSAYSAKEELEELIDAQCRVYWRPLLSSSCHSQVTERRCKLQFLRSLSGLKCDSRIRDACDNVYEIPPILPCRLLYALYYVSFVLCGSRVGCADIQSPWAHLFFGPMVRDLHLCGDWVPPRSNEETTLELRRNIAYLFSKNTSPDCGSFALSSLDACVFWILGDYRNALEHTKALLLQTKDLRRKWNKCPSEMGLLNMMHVVLLFIHIFAITLTTNMGRHESRCEVQTIIQRLIVQSHISEGINGFITRVLFSMHQELFSEDIDLVDALKSETKEKLDRFFFLLRIWLRAKRLTDSGRMEFSRDLLLQSLTELRTDEEILLLPVQWLRKLFFVNCAALADASTLLCVLRDWGNYAMRLSEVLYIAACPTLGAGGVHSSLFGWIYKEVKTRDLVGVIQRFPLPIQLPLLAHRLWRVRQSVVHCNVEDRIALKDEILLLCDVIVPLARGLAGTLELSFTDCAPHRLLFDAITTACDIQEDILRDATTFLSDDTSASQLTRTCRSDLRVVSDMVNPNIDTDTTASDAWLMVVRTLRNEEEVPTLSAKSSLHSSSSSSFSSSSSSSSSSSTSTNFSSTPSQSIYWRAHRRTMRWIGFLEDRYSHLRLTVQICRLRMAAASFDKSTAQLTRELLDPFGTNVLAIAHGARALFANLNIVAAERRICKALQIYPHSAEVQRLYCFMCVHSIASDLLETKKGWSADYVERYRGILPVRYKLRITSTTTATDEGGNLHMSHVIPVVLSILCVIFHVASLIFHLMNVTIPNGRIVSIYSDTNSSNFNILGNDNSSSSSMSSMTAEGSDGTTGVTLNWSFVLPFSIHLYFGFFTLAYAIAATTLSYFNAASTDDRFAALLYFIKVSMMHGYFVDDMSNRLVFSLRGVGLVNLVTAVQLVVKNIFLLDSFNNEMCSVSWDQDNTSNKNATHGLDYRECNYILVKWGAACVFLIGLFTVFCIALHNRAWRVLRSRDIITGSVATYITLFILDAAFFIVLFPVLFLCYAVLEPILFMMTVFFSLISSPLFVEHIPSIPGDEMLSTVGHGKQNTFGKVHDYGDNTTLFTAEVASQLRSRLCRSLPPRRWSKGRRHDYPIYCLYELHTFPSDGKVSKFICLASYIIYLYLFLHRVIWWKTHRSPLCSETAVQSALLQEAYAAVLPSSFSSFQSSEVSLNMGSPSRTLRNEQVRSDGKNQTAHCVDAQHSLFCTSPPFKSLGTTPYG